MSTVLELVQSFCGLKGLPIPTQLVGAGTPDSLQMKQIINLVGRDIRSFRTWERLKRRAEFVSIADEDQGLLSDILLENPAHIVPETLWNDTTRLPIYGPVGDRDYQAIKALIPQGPLYQYRIQAGHLLITGDIPAGQNLTLIYKSNSWLSISAALEETYVESVTADTNIPVWSDALMLAGMMYWWKKIKEQEASTELAEYNMLKVNEAGNDNVPPKISMHNQGQPIIRPAIVVPAGNWDVS